MSSDPKPREGTETLRRRIRDLFPRIGRQTQNPERGRKPAKYRLHDTTTTRRQTQNPERGRKLPRRLAITTPTNGRQTQNPERGRKRPVDGGCVVRASVVRPKTPRGDGNIRTSSRQRRKSPVVRPKTPRGDENAYPPPHHSHATAPCPQTQNPERGRKLVRHLCLIQVQCPVVRPKTPRGDGNFITPDQIGIGVFKSSDPKPREGTETHIARHTTATLLLHVLRPKTPRGDGNRFASDRFASIKSGRQTQNPERGRKLDAESHRVREVQQSSDPKPREGTKTHIPRHTTATLLLHVLRPKTPRGDGNLTARSFPASIR
ncbi:Uncharacterised protein [Mycobacterium tuberculosis]|nr:Uncharacterised protein [Mycobacterium tuberculosis]